ncbi:MAG: transposase, partial [Spirochaetaceae bacterium]|nr:transposase [Spirochaetaceae bacterium]
MSWIQKLYTTEKRLREKLKCKEISCEDFVTKRKAQTNPILAGFKEWLHKQSADAKLSWKLCDAVSYAINQWDCLIKYLEHGELTPDNNAAERAIKPFVIGRKNWMMSGSVDGAASSCQLYS